jgi:O-antigen/teichoic acid export membrane protein
MYPYFSGSDNKNQINAVLSSSIRYSAIFVFPLALLVSAFSGPLIAVFYKESYMAAIEPMVILAFASIFAIFSMLLSSFFSGIKRPDINTKTAIISVCIYFPMTFFLTSLYGIAGAASAFLIIKAVETIILLALAGLKHGSFLLKPSAITKPVFASVIMYFSAVFLFLPHVDGYLTLGIFGILSLLIYAAVLALTGGIRKEEVLYIKRWIRWIPGVSR